MYDFLFDSNCVRDFARRIKEPEWDSVWRAWKAAGYKTAWIPWTVGEIAGTNLPDPPRLTVELCKETSTAVRRFDRLTAHDVLPGPSDLIKWSMYKFIGREAPFLLNSDRHRETIEVAKLLEDPLQVRKSKAPDHTLLIELQDPRTKKWVGHTAPQTFAQHSEPRVEMWRARLAKSGNLRPDLSHEQVLEEILKRLNENIVGLGKQCGLADSVLIEFDNRPFEDRVDTCFAYGAAAQDWYCIRRALRLKTGRIEETTGRDLIITFYFPLATTFVTSDGDFVKLIKPVLPANTMSFQEFVQRLLGKGQRSREGGTCEKGNEGRAWA